MYLRGAWWRSAEKALFSWVIMGENLRDELGEGKMKTTSDEAGREEWWRRRRKRRKSWRGVSSGTWQIIRSDMGFVPLRWSVPKRWSAKGGCGCGCGGGGGVLMGCGEEGV